MNLYKNYAKFIVYTIYERNLIRKFESNGSVYDVKLPTRKNLNVPKKIIIHWIKLLVNMLDTLLNIFVD